jgi:hypothetical protein
MVSMAGRSLLFEVGGVVPAAAGLLGGLGETEGGAEGTSSTAITLNPKRDRVKRMGLRQAAALA